MPYTTDGKIGIDISTPTSARNYTLGTLADTTDGSQYMYVYSIVAQATGAAVAIASGFTAAAMGTALARTVNRVGFVQTPFAASQNGWVALSGTPIKVRTAASTLPAVPLYTSDTTGVLDDATASLSMFPVMGIVLLATQSTVGATNANVSWPLVRLVNP